MVSSRIIIFRLKPSSELSYDSGMLSSWESPLVEAGLKKQMSSWWLWIHGLCFWLASRGLLGLAMEFWGRLLGWAFLKTLLGVIRDSSTVAATEICSLVLVCEEGKSWMKFGMLEDAEGAKGRVTKQRVRAGILLTPLPDQHPQYLVYKVLFLSDRGSEDRI